MASIILAILYLSGLDKIPNDRPWLHQVFYALSKKYDCVNLVFKNDLMFPEAVELDEIMFSLMPGFLERDSTYGWLLIRKDTCDRWWTKEGKELLTKHPELKEIARSFKEFVQSKEE